MNINCVNDECLERKLNKLTNFVAQGLQLGSMSLVS